MMRTLNEMVLVYVCNALWQSILLWLVAEMTVRLFKSMRAAVMHRVWVGFFLLALTLPAIPLLSKIGIPANKVPVAITAATNALNLHPAFAHSPAVLNAPKLDFEGALSTIRIPETSPAPRRIDWIAAGLRALCVLYFASVLFALIKLISGLWRTVLIRRRAQLAQVSEELQNVWDTCRTAAGRPDVELLSSEDVVSPATMTLWRPVVILPFSLLDAGAEMTAAFCHELAHVRRRDFLKNLLYELIAIPLFFHPAVHCIRRRVQETRELACDDLAAELMDGRNAYAGNLVRLAESMAGNSTIKVGRVLGVFEGDVLERRVMNLIEKKVKQAGWRIAVSTVCGVLLLTVSCVASTRFGLRPVFAAGMQKVQPVVKAVVVTPAKAADLIASVEKPAQPDATPTITNVAPSNDAVNERTLVNETALLQPEPIGENGAEQKAAAPQGNIKDSVTYSGPPPKYPNPGDLKPVSFKLGSTRFEPGDSITIDELRGTSNKVVEGNLYQIKGHYILNSHEDALLAASVTTNSNTKSHGGSPSLNMSVNKGSGQFTLWLFMREHGDPHLSFYPSNGGSSFASVYFETGDGSPQGLNAITKKSTESSKDVPRGWGLAGDSPQRYRTGIDAQMPHDGKPSAYLVSRTEDVFKGFGTLSQFFLGSPYLGKRIRFRGWVKSENVKNWAGLWMRVDVDNEKPVAFDNMEQRAIKGTNDWKMYDIVLDVPKNASEIGMGILLDGPGKVWLSGVKIEIVPKTVATTDTMAPRPAGPVNLDFSR